MGSRGVRLAAASALTAAVAGAVLGSLALAGSSLATSTSPPGDVLPAAATSGTSGAGPATQGSSGPTATRGVSGPTATGGPPQSASPAPPASATTSSTPTTSLSTSTAPGPTPTAPAPAPASSTTTSQPEPQIGAPAGGTCPTAICYGP